MGVQLEYCLNSCKSKKDMLTISTKMCNLPLTNDNQKVLKLNHSIYLISNSPPKQWMILIPVVKCKILGSYACKLNEI